MNDTSEAVPYAWQTACAPHDVAITHATWRRREWFATDPLARCISVLGRGWELVATRGEAIASPFPFARPRYKLWRTIPPNSWLDGWRPIHAPRARPRRCFYIVTVAGGRRVDVGLA